MPLVYIEEIGKRVQFPEDMPPEKISEVIKTQVIPQYQQMTGTTTNAPAAPKEEEFVPPADTQQKKSFLNEQISNALGWGKWTVKEMADWLLHPVTKAEQVGVQGASEMGLLDASSKAWAESAIAQQQQLVPSFPQQKTPGAQWMAGLGNAVVDFANGIISPDAIGYIGGMGKLTEAGRRAVATAFASTMAVESPKALQQSAQLFKEGQTQDAVRAGAGGVGGLILTGLIAKQAGKESAMTKPVTPEVLSWKTEPSLTPVTDTVVAPEAAPVAAAGTAPPVKAKGKKGGPPKPTVEVVTEPETVSTEPLSIEFYPSEASGVGVTEQAWNKMAEWQRENVLSQITARRQAAREKAQAQAQRQAEKGAPQVPKPMVPSVPVTLQPVAGQTTYIQQQVAA